MPNFFDPTMPHSIRDFLSQTQGIPNVPTTPLERLQLALDAKAAAMAQARLPTPTTTAVRSIQVLPNGQPVLPPRSSYGTPPDTAQQTMAEQRGMRSVPSLPPMPPAGNLRGGGFSGTNYALQGSSNLNGVRIPSATGSIIQGKSQDRMPATPQLAFLGGNAMPPGSPGTGTATLSAPSGYISAYASPQPPMPPAVAAISNQIQPPPVPDNGGGLGGLLSGLTGGLGNAYNSARDYVGTQASNMVQPVEQLADQAKNAVINAAMMSPKARGAIIDPMLAQLLSPRFGTIASNPNKYGDTPQARQAAAAQRAALQSGMAVPPGNLSLPRLPMPQQITVNGGRQPAAVVQGPGPNGKAGQGTIYNNPTKYGTTTQDRQAAAQRRAALAAFGGN